MFSNVQLFFFSFFKMNEQLLNLLDAVQRLHSFCYSLLFAFKMNSKCSRISHLEHLKIQNTEKLLGGRGSAPDPTGELTTLAQLVGRCSPLPSQEPHPLRPFGPQAAVLRALPSPFPIILPTSRYPPTPLSLISDKQSDCN